MRKQASLFFMLCVLLTDNARAEYCDMVGPAYDIRWIHIPRSQYVYANETSFILNSKDRYTYIRDDRLFVEDGLPKVNQIVEINHDVAYTVLPNCLPKENCSKGELDYLKRITDVNSHVDILDKEKKIARIDPAAYYCTEGGGRRGCWDLNEGAKVRILNFSYLEGLLFALVLIESC